MKRKLAKNHESFGSYNVEGVLAIKTEDGQEGMWLGVLLLRGLRVKRRSHFVGNGS
ncbi:MAG: hypothetical protein RIC16_00130 [Rhodospirillales bacterium]